MTLASNKQRRNEALDRQIVRLKRQIADLQKRSSHLSSIRLSLFLLGFAVSGALFFTTGPEAAFLALPLWFLPFVATVYLHRRLQSSLLERSAYLRIKERHLAASNLQWDQLPEARFPNVDPIHPFSFDLDIQGQYSIHRLLDDTATIEGSQRLLNWLLEPYPEMEVVAHRQALSQQLVVMTTFRDKLQLYTSLTSKPGPDEPLAAPLIAWLQMPGGGPRRWLLFLLFLLGVTTGVLAVLALLGELPPVWLASLFAYFALYGLFGRGAGALFRQTLALRDAFEQLRDVFTFLEKRRFAVGQDLVREQCRPFQASDNCPSRYITRLQRITTAASLSQNPVMWFILNVFFPWDLFFSYRLFRLRSQLASLAPQWLDAVFELEAAGALACLHYLNPQYTVPRFLAPESSPPFTGLGLGHPLINDNVKISNDFTLLKRGDVVLITGSNMAGKSSFLRTLGVNLCLAYAGGPVDAQALDTRYFRLFTSIRMTDSVTDGISYFYAEVKRLRTLLQEVQTDDPRAVFFLIDEIFRGTNNRERLIGSRAYIRSLIDGNGLGVVSTHDLDLVSLAVDNESVTNYHFRDSIADGRMIFDYCLRPGPCPTTNALKIMRHEGLPVEDGFGNDQW